MSVLFVVICISLGSILGGIFLIWNSYRNYQNRPLQKNWRMMTVIPGYGKYWGLASQGMVGALAVYCGLCLPFLFMTRSGGESNFDMIFYVFLFIMIITSMVLSYWLPEKWIPQWLKDVEREEAAERERRRRIMQARRRR